MRLDALAAQALAESGEAEPGGTTTYRISPATANPDALAALGYSIAVVGEVTRSESFRDAGVDGFPGDIFTEHALKVEQRLSPAAADLGDSVLVRQDGGVSGSEYREIVDAPLLRPGRRYILILGHGANENTYSVLPFTFFELDEGIVAEPTLPIGRQGKLALLLLGRSESDAARALTAWLESAN
jgi:hypothetical protein